VCDATRQTVFSPLVANGTTIQKDSWIHVIGNLSIAGKTFTVDDSQVIISGGTLVTDNATALMIICSENATYSYIFSNESVLLSGSMTVVMNVSTVGIYFVPLVASPAGVTSTPNSLNLHVVSAPQSSYSVCNVDQALNSQNGFDILVQVQSECSSSKTGGSAGSIPSWQIGVICAAAVIFSAIVVFLSVKEVRGRTLHLGMQLKRTRLGSRSTPVSVRESDL